MKKLFKILLITVAIAAGLCLIAAYPSYLLTKHLFNQYFDAWGEKLVSLEKRGMLSREYGAAWKDVIADEEMAREAGLIVKDSAREDDGGIDIVDGVRLSDYPSLSIIEKLNAVQAYSNRIEITDRRGREIADIRTNHTRAKISEFPKTLITALLTAEDKNFRENELGFEFDSYVRAALRAVFNSITRFRLVSPKGTSTITQQVAKLFISDIDEEGRREVHRSVDRKIREMRISTALRKMYEPNEILEVYVNHCVTSDYGLIGYGDIARGLLGKDLSELNDAESVYLARMVKWGRNLHSKIAYQCRIDMPRMGEALGWGEDKQQQVLAAIDTLTFSKPRTIRTHFGHLVDCANEFWLDVIERTGRGINREDMDIINPNSLIRKKGNLSIRLTIDLPLQRELERLVNARGYGGDTVITTDVRIGSIGENVQPTRTPIDTLRRITIIEEPTEFAEPHGTLATTLEPGDSLITNIRYRKLGKGQYRRSSFYYTRKPMKVDGQYYAYCILDSKTGELLAYYSRDRIGSRLVSLLHNRTPNGSSTAKPIFHALNFDLGTFKPYDKWTDEVAVKEDVPWKRDFVRENGKPIGVMFAKSAVPGRGWKMSNHGHIFEGCHYVYDHLATSNNILGVELVYRLNRTMFGGTEEERREALMLNQFLYRIGAFGRIKNDLKLTRVTGVRVYKELARIVGVDIDSMTAYGRRVPVSDSLYSVGLGTLELTLYEQAHLFNCLYNNDLIEKPALHPTLVIDQIILNGKEIDIAQVDTVRRYHPFGDINNLRPVYLGLHKRLVGNKWDGLTDYDVPYSSTYSSVGGDDSTFDEDVMTIGGPLSNFAKSGTTDDVLRPFNADITSKRRTNYGLWNAVVRIDLNKLSKQSRPAEIKDITIACIGEGNREYTGPRDGKTLHKFLSRELLKKAGRPSPNGFYAQYEQYIQRVTPEPVRNCLPYDEEEAKEERESGLKGLLGKLRDRESKEEF